MNEARRRVCDVLERFVRPQLPKNVSVQVEGGEVVYLDDPSASGVAVQIWVYLMDGDA